jgi:hypothetical protein
MRRHHFITSCNSTTLDSSTVTETVTSSQQQCQQIVPGCPNNRCLNLSQCTCCPGSALLFSGFVAVNQCCATIGPQYNTLGLGIAAFPGVNTFQSIHGTAPLLGTTSKEINTPLLLPVQFTSSNKGGDIAVTTPQDIYVRIPGTGRRFLRGLRCSIEYPKAIDFSFVVPTSPVIIGIWTGSIPDGFTPAILAQSALTVQLTFFDPQAAGSHFQSASNLTNVIAVNGGDYIAMVVLVTQTLGYAFGDLPYIEASVELI